MAVRQDSRSARYWTRFPRRQGAAASTAWDSGYLQGVRRSRSSRFFSQPGGSAGNQGYSMALLILFTDRLGIGLAVGIEEFLAALLPSGFEFGRGDVPVRAAFPGNGA